jgi:hypothetical protein
MIKYKELIQVITESVNDDYSVIHDKNGIKVHEVKTHDGMKSLGKGTVWDTANNSKEGKKAFDDKTGYTDWGNDIVKKTVDNSTGYRGDTYKEYYGREHYEPEEEKKIYVVHAKDKNGKTAKYKFHHDGVEYYDKNYNEVNLHELVKRNPELKNVKEFQGYHPALTK